jgi:hypothetical protein
MPAGTVRGTLWGLAQQYRAPGVAQVRGGLTREEIQVKTLVPGHEWGLSSVGEQLPCKEKVKSSNLLGSTQYNGL